MVLSWLQETAFRKSFRPISSKVHQRGGLFCDNVVIRFIFQLVQAPGSPSHLDPVETDELLRKYKIDTLITVYVHTSGEKT